ncbi:MAG: hypothetical protein H0U67_09375 [Gemmatimonadetes bacterium]|nr:hypothetical protein [Gemmatimonadota bacterium]
MAGRKKKPRHLKLVTNKPGKGIQPPPVELTGEVRRPKMLDRRKRARELWEEKSPTLIRLGILNPITVTQFGNWCEMQARYERRPAEFNASMLAQLRALGSCYGLDYIAWEKVSAGKEEGERDPTADYFEASS